MSIGKYIILKWVSKSSFERFHEMNPCIIIPASMHACTFIMKQCRFLASKYPYMTYYLLVECLRDALGYHDMHLSCDTEWYFQSFKIAYFVSANICYSFFDDKPSWSIAQSLQSILQLLRTFLKNYIGGLQILFVSEPTHTSIDRHIHKEIE